jgi:primosomal protein N' (replication factor Y)
MNHGDETRPPTQRHFRVGERVAVLLPLPLDQPYDYRVDDDAGVIVGQIVQVPLGPRVVAGVVWGAGAAALGEERIKPIVRRIDLPPLAAPLRRFVDWLAAHTVQPRGAVLRMVLSTPAAFDAPAPRFVVALPDGPPDARLAGIRLTAARAKVLAAAGAGPPRAISDLAAAAGVTPSVVRSLIAAGALQLRAEHPAPPPWPGALPAGPILSAEQAAAAWRLAAGVGGGFAATLLDGVPGSGKTEVYFEAIAAAIRRHVQTLVLLPEIALGAQWLARFAGRFGFAPASWHSELSGGVRRETWRQVAEGTVPVVVGARSALFLPYRRLGLIVVDEEHDGSFKQDDGVAYHGRDMAVVRARLEAAPIVLVSATPALETMINVEEGRYAEVRLPARFAATPPPPIEIVDLRATPPMRGEWLAPPLREAITAALADGEQALLFLNRRGYAPLTLCRACGHRLRCPNCTAWLVEHRLTRQLACHHCGHRIPIPSACPACGAEDKLAACGPGVERLAEEVAGLWPDARVVQATSDTLTGPAAAAALIERIAEHDLDIVIGTQLVAKGHHFPMLTLVGIVDADLGLGGGELRAAERTFQLLTQVAGRAGRALRPGRVLLQTAEPDHPVITAIAGRDRDGFLAAEAADRRRAGMPPFGRLAALILSGRDEAAVDAAAAALARASPIVPGVRILGPAPAPLAILRGRHRRRFLIKAPRRAVLAPVIRDWLRAVPLTGDLRVQVDVDPQNFL